MFTERVKKVMILAREESRCLGHDYVGPEHILLGIIRDGEGVANKLLTNLGVESDTIKKSIEDGVAKGGGSTPVGQAPFKPQAKKLLDVATKEAKEMKVKYVGTEHLLLALAKEADSVPARVLVAQNADYKRIKDALLSYVAASGRGGKA